MSSGTSYGILIRHAGGAIVVACLLVTLAAGGAGAQEVDVVIDGNGAGIYGAPGSGAGGSSMRFAVSPGTVEFTIEVHNYYSKKNKYTITWNQVPGWVTAVDGTPSPYQTPNINPGASFTATFQVTVPEGVTPAEFPFIIDVQAVKFKNKPWESVGARVQVTETLMGVIEGRVFDDRDHDGVFSPGDVGMSGVVLQEDVGGTSVITAADGSYSFLLPAGVPVTVTEQNPSGYLSLSSDVAGPITLANGDTITVDFADVPPLTLTPGVVLNGLAGSYVDFPHRLDAGTRGQVTLTASNDAGSTTMLYLDANGNGIFDTGDRPLQPSDLLMDPVLGPMQLDILVRVFVPAAMVPGDMITLSIDAVQEVENTPFTFSCAAQDVVVVTGTAVGRLTLIKQTDLAAGVPGDIITYTISYMNAGTDTLQNVVLLDPISGFVNLVTDGFGAGRDVLWQPPGEPVRYLTIDAADGDECEYSVSERMVRVIFSKNSSVLIPPGEGGTISYKVVIQ